jgi:hypothetical protein
MELLPSKLCLNLLTFSTEVGSYLYKILLSTGKLGRKLEKDRRDLNRGMDLGSLLCRSRRDVSRTRTTSRSSSGKEKLL